MRKNPSLCGAPRRIGPGLLGVAILAGAASAGLGCIIQPTVGYTRPFDPIKRRDGVAVNTYTALFALFEPMKSSRFPFAFDTGPMMRARFSDLETQVSAAAAGRLVYPGAHSRVSAYLMPGFHVLQISHIGSRTDVSTLSPFGELGMSVGLIETLALTVSGGVEYDLSFSSGRMNRGYWSGALGLCFGGCYLPDDK